MRIDLLSFKYLVEGLRGKKPSTVKDLVQWMLMQSDYDGTALTVDEITKTLLTTIRAGVEVFRLQNDEPLAGSIAEDALLAKIPEPEEIALTVPEFGQLLVDLTSNESFIASMQEKVLPEPEEEEIPVSFGVSVGRSGTVGPVRVESSVPAIHNLAKPVPPPSEDNPKALSQLTTGLLAYDNMKPGLPDFKSLAWGNTAPDFDQIIASLPQEPSNYQRDIYRWVAEGTGNGMAEGVAGCGKTTTIVNALKFRPSDEEILLLAFGRDIAKVLREKVKLPNVDIYTFNALGWQACRNNVRGVRLEKYKNLKDREILMSLVSPRYEEERYNRLKNPVLRLIGLLKALNERSIDRYQEIADEYGVELHNLKSGDKFADVLRHVWVESINDTSYMSYDDQIFQPVMRDWQFKKYKFILVDESQDASPINMEIIKRSLAPNGRILLVGDPDQAIMMFRGAHSDAMGIMAADLSVTHLPLSVCYRCPDAVIESAKEQVPRIEAPSPNPRGKGVVETITTPEFQEAVRPGDLVVSRMTHPLVKRCLIQWAKGRRALVKGKDFADQIIELIEKIHGDPAKLKQQYNSLKPQIDEYKAMREIDPSMGKMPVPSASPDCERFRDALAAYIAEQKKSLIQRGLEEQAERLEDQQTGILHLSEGCTHVMQIIVKIEEMFTEGEDDHVVMFMTGHKAKGLEYDNVYILRPDLCPSKRAKTPAQRKQEYNLLYVMKTRAMKELYFVEPEKDEK